MISDSTRIGRLEWAARLQRQAQQMRVIAVKAQSPAMQRELMEYATRLVDQALRLLAAEHNDPEAGSEYDV